MLDTKPDPRNPKVVRTSTADELAAKAGYSRPHTVHCGPGGIFLFDLGGANGNDGPGGVALLDHDTFDVIGAWEHDRGDQYFAYDGWWHLNHDTMITSEWATPSMFENGLNPEDLLGRRFGHHLNFWSHVPAHADPADRPGRRPPAGVRGAPGPRPGQGVGLRRAWSSASRTCPGRCGSGTATATAGRPARSSPSRPSRPTPSCCPPALKPFGAVPPLISDIDLSVDDRWLYVSCWGTGELKQYDVSDIFHPRETGSVKPRRHRRPPAPPGRARPAAGWRAPDGRGQPRRPAGLCHQLAVRGLGRHLLPRRRRRLGGQAGRRPGRRRHQPWTRGSSPTATTSAGCGSTRPACRPATPPATPTATPADHAPLAHHAGRAGPRPAAAARAAAGLSLLVAIGRARLAAARAKLTRARRRP